MLDRLDQAVIKDTTRQFEPENLGVSSLTWWHTTSQADSLLPRWGSRERDYRLRDYWYASHGTLVQGAISGLIKRIVATPWEIKGGRNLTRRYQEMLQNVEFGEGWKTFWTKVLTDYYTQDAGAFVEVIGGGRPDEPIKGGVIGLAHLDRQRCIPTGNLEYPVVYYNDVIDTETDKPTFHKLHYSRVIRFTDMVSPIERAFGNGLCALSRAISIANAQILMGRYQNERLSNEPPVGFISFRNVRRDYVDNVKAMWSADRSTMGASTYAPYMWLESADPDNPVEVSVTELAQWPEIGSYKDAMEVHVNMLALALNEDPQEIWPLTGQALGTGTQSKVLHAKGRAKAFADAMTMIERALNLWVLPEALEFAFKYNDAERDKEEAESAAIWTNVVNSANYLTDDEKRQLLANRVPAIADVLFDEAGNIRLLDDDIEPEQEITANDDTTLAAANQTEEAEDAAAEDASAADFGAGESDVEQRQVSASGGMAGQSGRGEQRLSRVWLKDYLITSSEFITNLADLIAGGLAGEIERRRFGALMRAQLSKSGRQAYLDGLEDGGIESAELDDEDLTIIASVYSDQAGYIAEFAERVYSGDSQMTPEARAIAWANKSLEPFYQRGLLSADQNGLYEWRYGDTEHCDDCKRLNGQRHRLKEWHAKGWIPRADKLKCGGYNCKCELVRAKGRARGRF